MRRALSAMPIAAQMPWPSDPVATSTNGSRGVGMPFEIRFDRPQLQQLLAREQAGLGPGRVENRRGVPLRQHEAIVVGILRLLRVVAHLAEEQRRHDVGGRQAGRRMAAAGLARGSDRIDAKLGRDVLQCGDGESGHGVLCLA